MSVTAAASHPPRQPRSWLTCNVGQEMKIRLFFALLASVLLVAPASAATDASETEVTEVIQRIMQMLERGTLLVTLPPGKPLATMGWTMPHPSGEEVSRTVLQMQCSAITPYGWRAVPELLKWLDHKQAFMRYIAAYSLKEITGLNPEFYYFGVPNQSFGGDPDWFEKAKGTWSSWYLNLVHKENPPNQALQHNDPSCHAPCVRTCRASRGRG